MGAAAGVVSAHRCADRQQSLPLLHAEHVHFGAAETGLSWDDDVLRLLFLVRRRSSASARAARARVNRRLSRSGESAPRLRRRNKMRLTTTTDAIRPAKLRGQRASIYSGASSLCAQKGSSYQGQGCSSHVLTAAHTLAEGGASSLPRLRSLGVILSRVAVCISGISCCPQGCSTLPAKNTGSGGTDGRAARG